MAYQTEIGGVPTEGVHAYVRTTEGDHVDIRARMMFGGIEDAATGSANCALMGLLASQRIDAGQLQLTIAQGVEVRALMLYRLSQPGIAMQLSEQENMVLNSFDYSGFVWSPFANLTLTATLLYIRRWAARRC